MTAVRPLQATQLTTAGLAEEEVQETLATPVISLALTLPKYSRMAAAMDPLLSQSLCFENPSRDSHKSCRQFYLDSVGCKLSAILLCAASGQGERSCVLHDPAYHSYQVFLT